MARSRTRIWTTRLTVSLIALAIIFGPSAWRAYHKLTAFNETLKTSTPPGTLPTSTPSSLETSVGPHPLDPVLELARDYLQGFQRNVQDYTATLTKRERINGTLGDEEKMLLKLRCPRKNPDGTETKLHVYLRGKEPKKIEGREVIWVDGRYDGKLIAHEAGWMGMLRVQLDPHGSLAMTGNKYPITSIGVEQLIIKLIEKGERDRKHGACEVSIQENQNWNDQVCTIVEVKHLNKRPEFDFHIARIYLDTNLRIPVRYEAFLWPIKPNEEPPLEEQYSYSDVKLNVGLQDDDFDPENKAYQFP